jgi:hypothetical protein
VGSGSFGIDAHLLVPHKGPPQGHQHCELQRDSDAEVADETVLWGFHVQIDIKTHATSDTTKKVISINELAIGRSRHCHAAV